VAHHQEPPVDERSQTESQWHQHHREEMSQANKVTEASMERANVEERQPWTTISTLPAPTESTAAR
jgi:hypothetical protein